MTNIPEHKKNNTYGKLLRQSEWQKKRRHVIRRDGRKCANCGSTELFSVHHRQYQTDNRTGRHKEPWNYKLKYLVTLCRDCHLAGHRKYRVKIFKLKTN